jgi:hypothetical protein
MANGGHRFGDQVDRIAPLVFADDCIQKPSSLVFLSIADQGIVELRLFFNHADLHRSPAAGGHRRAAFGCGSPSHRQLSLGVVYWPHSRVP